MYAPSFVFPTISFGKTRYHLRYNRKYEIGQWGRHPPLAGQHTPACAPVRLIPACGYDGHVTNRSI